ncbi:hypothetical protein AWZ03_004059 [Drosophila navojoa]|uniref:SCP domain-containing protein n=3 Tax=Drosophila navojoa TaxID=7232 RepID=A0A484BLF5_DRONA|nr:hypothetical protein AWZ03_004059 [Drosophila navojoa]
MKDILSYNSKEDAPPHNFLQIVHDKVQKIGCACLKQSKNGWIQNFFTCNYDEAPIKGQEVYKTGIPGAQCVSGKNHNFTSLCGEVDLGDVDRDQPEPNNQTQTTQVDHQNKPDNQTEAPQVDPQNKPDNQTRILSRTIAATNAIIGTIEIRPSMTSLEDLQLNRTIERGIEKEAKERRERFHRFLAEIEKTERKTNNRKIQIFTWNHQVDISIKPEDE